MPDIPHSDRISANLLLRLKYECEVMRSRCQAILNCDDAIAELCAADIFGTGYQDLLEADVEWLSEAIGLVEAEMSMSSS